MKTQKTFDGQTATFIARLASSFPTDLTREEMQRCIDDAKGLRSTIRDWLRPTVTKQGIGSTKQFLKLLGKVVVDINQSPTKDLVDKFLKNRDGLWVNSGFRDLFVGDDNNSTKTTQLSKYCLTKDAGDSAIRKALPENHVFSSDEFRHILSAMLTKQWGGKDGDLITNGYTNIFYVWKKDKTQVFTVCVFWDPCEREWIVDVFKLGGLHAVRAVFSRN